MLASEQESIAALMHLADYEEATINSRISTQATQFEEKLAELNEHMEKVIQMYLRNEYATIAEYNAQAGSIAEKYHFLVIASFPVNFSDVAARRLRNIAANGARCGVYTLIHWDQRNAPPNDFVPDEMRKNSVRLVRAEKDFLLADWREAGARLVLDPPPSSDFATQFLHDVGESGRGSTRVEVPFEQVAPADAEVWTEETTEEVRVPIGRSGATKMQYLEIGRGTRQHALIAGKTGSGKSTLFHIIVTNLALWCGPEQVEFYLVDFKKGVEFKCYANRRPRQAGLEIRTIPIEVPPDLVLPTAMPPVAPDFKTVDIVYAGRIIGVGSGSRDSIALVDELADLLGAAIGTTRVVVDDGFFPKIRMIGQTGKTVSPGLYLALGVSGSPHHVAGIQGSIEVLSVNTDPNAPIFGFSDKGFVGDLRSLLPKLVDRIRRYRDEGLP